MFIPSAVIILAAALEASIGEATFVKCRKLLGHNNYENVAKAICKLGPMQRLESLVPLATRGEYVLRKKGTKLIELIRALIPLRNKLMHQNLEYLEFEVADASIDSPASYSLVFPDKFRKHLERINISGNQLEDYWQAYYGLKESFLRTQEYKEDDYLTSNEED